MKNSSQNQLFSLFKLRYDIVIGFLIFVPYRFLFTYLLWKGRGVPPISDNAYFYISSAHNLFSIQNFEQFRLVIFSSFLNLLALFTGGNLESAFKLNFFIGPLVMFAALAYFLNKLEPNKNIRLLLILILSLYSGSGAYHGFFWVVPSFYQLALFFILSGIVVSREKISPLLVFAITFIFIFAHPTSIFASSIFFVYFFLLLISKRTSKNLRRNFKNIVISLSISFVFYYLLGRLFPAADSPESFQASTNLLKDFLSGHIQAISFPIIWQEYFAIFFFNPIFATAYLVMFLYVSLARQTKVLTLYIASSSFVFVGAFVPYGARTLEFLWPLTFVVIGYSLVGSYTFFNKIRKNLGYISVLPLIALIIFSSLFNFISIKTLNASKNYFWDRSCPGKLSNSKIYFTNLEALYAFSLYGPKQPDEIFLTEKYLPDFLTPGSYLVITGDTLNKGAKLSKVEEGAANLITRRKSTVQVVFPTNSWTVKPVSNNLINENLDKNNMKSSLIYDCGKYMIYQLRNI